MKRIILFISSLQKGGSERVMVNLAEYFHEKRYDVILVTQYQRENEYKILPEIRRVYSEPEETMLTGGENPEFLRPVPDASEYLEGVQTGCSLVISRKK